MRGKNAVETLILQWKSYEYTSHNTLNHFKGQVSSTCLKINIFYVSWHMITFESLCLLTCVCISRFLICNSSFITDRDLNLHPAEKSQERRFIHGIILGIKLTPGNPTIPLRALKTLHFLYHAIIT